MLDQAKKFKENDSCSSEDEHENRDEKE